jgi:hypothetical protein
MSRSVAQVATQTILAGRDWLALVIQLEEADVGRRCQDLTRQISVDAVLGAARSTRAT